MWETLLNNHLIKGGDWHKSVLWSGSCARLALNAKVHPLAGFCCWKCGRGLHLFFTMDGSTLLSSISSPVEDNKFYRRIFIHAIFIECTSSISDDSFQNTTPFLIWKTVFCYVFSVKKTTLWWSDVEDIIQSITTFHKLHENTFILYIFPVLPSLNYISCVISETDFLYCTKKNYCIFFNIKMSSMCAE